MTEEEYQAAAQQIADQITPHFAAIEALTAESLELSDQYGNKAIHRLNKRFWRKIAAAHEAGSDVCQAAGMNEGGK